MGILSVADDEDGADDGCQSKAGKVSRPKAGDDEEQKSKAQEEGTKAFFWGAGEEDDKGAGDDFPEPPSGHVVNRAEPSAVSDETGDGFLPFAGQPVLEIDEEGGDGDEG